jgi:cell division protein FtsB
MAHASAQTADVFRGGISSPARPRSPFATRRRVLVVASLLLVLGLALAMNYGPIQAYRDAHAHLQAAAAQVSALERQKAQMQAQLGKLSEAGYLESLARQELTYARPGEQVFILTGGAGSSDASAGAAQNAGDAGDTAPSAPGTATHPGFLERLLTAIAGLF